MTTEQAVVSFVVVVVNPGRIHSTSVSSTTCVSILMLLRKLSRGPLTHVLTDPLGEGLSKSPIVHCIAIAVCDHYQFLLAFVRNEEGTQFLGVRIDAVSP